MKLLRVAAVVMTGLFFCIGAVAGANPVVKLALSQSLIVRDKGKVVSAPIPPSGTKYGDTIRYAIEAGNAGDEPAFHLQPIGNIPNGTAFIAGSASPAIGIEYSVDGIHWAHAPTIVVRDAQGKTVKALAPPSSFRKLRWTVAKLTPHQRAHFSYEVVVK